MGAADERSPRGHLQRQRRGGGGWALALAVCCVVRVKKMLTKYFAKLLTCVAPVSCELTTMDRRVGGEKGCRGRGGSDVV